MSSAVWILAGFFVLVLAVMFWAILSGARSTEAQASVFKRWEDPETGK